ncbi:sigma-E factor negative regulatory protein [Deltaproteobacteria bacterium]|nr:sigma-E factor negative regulatory protein [Deltaproteobacteria bacterium]
MSERLRESVSALMDGEAGELELRRLLTEPDELSVRNSWQSYHRLQVVLKEEPAEFLGWDISERVSSAIEDNSQLSTITSRRPKWLQPVAGFAVAASVAAAVVMTVGNLNPGNSGLGAAQPDMLSRVFPATGGLAVSAGDNRANVRPAMTPMVLPGGDAQADEDARKRLDQYILRHTESAALNNGQGMISYARVANFDVE